MPQTPLPPDYRLTLGRTELATLHADGTVTLRGGERVGGRSLQQRFKQGGHFRMTSRSGRTDIEVVRPGRADQRFTYRGVCWLAESADPQPADEATAHVCVDQQANGGPAASDKRRRLPVSALLVLGGFLTVVGGGLFASRFLGLPLETTDGLGNDGGLAVSDAGQPGSSHDQWTATDAPGTFQELGDSFATLQEYSQGISQAAAQYGRTHRELAKQVLQLTPQQDKQINDFLDRFEQYVTHILAYSDSLSEKRVALISLEAEMASLHRGTGSTAQRQKQLYRELLDWQPDSDQRALMNACRVREDINTSRPQLVDEARQKLLRQQFTWADMLEQLVVLRCLQVELKQWCGVEERLVEFLPHLPAELVLQAEIDLSPPASGDAKQVYPARLQQDARMLETLLDDRAEPFRIPWDIAAVEKWLADYADLPKGYAGLSGRAVLHPDGRIEQQTSQAALDGTWERLSGDARRRSGRNPDHDIIQLRDEIARQLEAELGPAPTTSSSRSDLDLSAPPASNTELQAEIRIISLLLEDWHADLPKGDDRFYAEMRDEYDALTMRLNELYAQANARDDREETLAGIRQDQQRLSGRTPQRRSRRTAREQGVPSLSGYNPLADEFAQADKKHRLSAADLNAERRVLLRMFEDWDDNLRSGRSETYYEFKDRQKAKLQARYRDVNDEMRQHLNPFNR